MVGSRWRATIARPWKRSQRRNTKQINIRYLTQIGTTDIVVPKSEDWHCKENDHVIHIKKLNIFTSYSRRSWTHFRNITTAISWWHDYKDIWNEHLDHQLAPHCQQSKNKTRNSKIVSIKFCWFTNLWRRTLIRLILIRLRDSWNFSNYNHRLLLLTSWRIFW